MARASLEELLGDYRDYLRQHGHAQWDKNSREALYVRKLGARNDESYEFYRSYIETRPAETVAKAPADPRVPAGRWAEADRRPSRQAPWRVPASGPASPG